jgi:hypothetical protein
MKACRRAAWSRLPRPSAKLVVFGGAALFLALVTLATYRLLARYEPDPQGYITNPGFVRATGEAVPSGWRVEGDPAGIVVDGGTLQLTNTDPLGGIGLVQVVERKLGDASVFDLSVVAGAEEVEGGQRYWRGARITMAIPHEGELPRGRNRQLANMQGNRALRAYSKRFTFGSGAPQVELALRLRHATGTLLVRDLKVTACGNGRASARSPLSSAWPGLGSPLPPSCWRCAASRNAVSGWRCWRWRRSRPSSSSCRRCSAIRSAACSAAVSPA